MATDALRIALCQIAPIWLQRDATLGKVADWIDRSARENCELIIFGEALVPVYPFWVERTSGAEFESALQKSLYAHYVSQAVCTEDGDLDIVCQAAALYAQGEDLHVAIWPGNLRNTEDVTRHIARESRSFVASVSGLMRRQDIADQLPHAELLREVADDIMANGGSCLAAPNGDWILQPEIDTESLRVAEIEHRLVLEERHSLDVAGHYSRPDVTRLIVNRKRQTTAEFVD
ncbi:MAG: hypothetical protein OEQ14_02985 [Gammaproteobacteria bacterium]|nr:hypothetical protein [Gammaproteobacteria bacterium]